MPKDEFESKTAIADLSKIQGASTPKEEGIPCLVQYNGANIGTRYLLYKEKTNIGRSADCDISLPDISISRQHAFIYNDKSGVFVEDTNSSNGTFVNEKKITSKSQLKDQDTLRLGTLLLKFFSKDNVDGFIQDKIYRLATIDAGTQIFNKQYLQDTLENQFRKAKSSGKDLTIIYFDLDHFKKVNDTYGHVAGDQVLRDIAKLVKKTVRKEDTFARFGGEEFVIILPNTNLEQAIKIAETIKQKCETFVQNIIYELNGIKTQADYIQTISLGLATCQQQMNSPKDLLEAADQKLYQSKKNGRNRLTF